MRSIGTSIGTSIAITVALAACRDDPPGSGSERQTVVELRATPERDLDLLFVVDDSPGMLEAQINLRNSFPVFLERLQSAPGGFPNLHLGVVSTDMGTTASGSALPGPAIGQLGNGGCSGTGQGGALQVRNAQVTDRFLKDVEGAGGGRTRNYTGTLQENFDAMVTLGAGGCGFEQPLAAMRAALDNHPSNTGFLRPEAMLGVVFLADEDDCSAKSTSIFGPESPAIGPLQSFRCTRFGVTCTVGGSTPDAMNEPGDKTGCRANATSELVDDTAPYRDFLAGLKPDARNVVVAGIAAPGDTIAVELAAPPGGGSPAPTLAHGCTFDSPMGVVVANPATRLYSFLEAFPERLASATICQRDLSEGLVRIANVLRRAMGGSPCIEEPLADVNPKSMGTEVDCVVEDLVGDAATAIEACEADADARPCWRLEADPATCAGSRPPSWKLVVQRDGAPAPDPATVTRMRCRVAP